MNTVSKIQPDVLGENLGHSGSSGAHDATGGSDHLLSIVVKK